MLWDRPRGRVARPTWRRVARRRTLARERARTRGEGGRTARKTPVTGGVELVTRRRGVSTESAVGGGFLLFADPICVSDDARQRHCPTHRRSASVRRMGRSGWSPIGAWGLFHPMNETRVLRRGEASDGAIRFTRCKDRRSAAPEKALFHGMKRMRVDRTGAGQFVSPGESRSGAPPSR